jgi:hypothetical protein
MVTWKKAYRCATGGSHDVPPLFVMKSFDFVVDLGSLSGQAGAKIRFSGRDSRPSRGKLRTLD